MQIMAKHRIGHDQFSQLAAKLVKAAPPCMSSTFDWEPTAAALEELNISLEHDNPAALTPLPDASGKAMHMSFVSRVEPMQKFILTALLCSLSG